MYVSFPKIEAHIHLCSNKINTPSSFHTIVDKTNFAKGFYMPTTLDLYKMYETLSTEEQQIWQSAQSFVEKEFMPKITAHHRDATFPSELIPQLGKLGFLGFRIATSRRIWLCGHW